MVATIQTAPEDCTGCGLCVHACPVKNKQQPDRKAINMVDQIPIRAVERENYQFFLGLPEFDRTQVKINSVKGSQLLGPFEYSGACAGCGETPYVKLLSQLLATGRSSPTPPAARRSMAATCRPHRGPRTSDGRGPAWSNSLFEDNAEFGFGFRLTVDKQTEYARELVQRLRGLIGDELADGILTAPQATEADIAAQRARVAELKIRLAAARVQR